MSDPVDDWQTAQEAELNDPSALAHLARFDAVATEAPGIINLGQDLAAVVRLGACREATDLGDLIDRVVATGARPVGLLDSLRFRPLDDPATKDSLPTVVAGLGAYARQHGVPIVGGELSFESGESEPLITALGVGIVSRDDLRPTDDPASDTEPRPFARPGWIDALNAQDANRLPRDNAPDAQRAMLLRIVASPTLCDKSWVTDQFDRYAGGHTVLAQPEDAGMLRVDVATGVGLALTLDSRPRMAALNPYLGAQHALAEAYRNVAATGARPRAVATHLAAGNPDDPQIMWQFVEMVLGLVDGCGELGTPVADRSGSFARGTGDARPLPTPLVAMIGVIDDVARRTPMGFAEPGDEIWLLGETREELSGTVWADVAHDGHLGGMPPRIDFAAEKRLAAVLGEAARAEVLVSAHDLAEGGLAQALVESCLRRGFGAEIDLGGGDPTVELYAESTARVLVSLPGERVGELRALADKHDVPLRRLGSVAGDGAKAALQIEGLFTISLVELRGARAATLPTALS
ncbi:AIR synthase related protein [Ammonicoccus fulvus]|uniref:AIR synthase related protein n=1 Tax=Ammonicoccus fulvus TaxID=3138240 RepID=A0ABZ3FJ55_9ACTN